MSVKADIEKSMTIPEMEGSGRKQKREKETQIINIEDDDNQLLFFPPIFSTKGSSTSNAISVEEYTEGIDLNRPIIDPPFHSNTKVFIDLSEDYNDDEVRVLPFEPPNTRFGKRRKTAVTGESSNSETDQGFDCEICVDTKSANDLFRVQGCSHSYCRECMINYVASKLQENITGIRCPMPGCTGLLEPDYCRPFLPQEVFDRWGNALCEAVILDSQKFYCPYPDCSVLLIDDGEQAIEESECPNCRRLFCGRCRVPWHVGITCEAFKELAKDGRGIEDLKLMSLAEKQQWRRCPHCNFYVQKASGCQFIRCRCGIEFCYNCGTRVVKSHVCPNCFKHLRR